jgi:LuxR family maltose regulon positive regulatory protein
MVRRRRAFALLHEQLDLRLNVVLAPAGFGKTSLLVDFAHDCLARGIPVCWYSLEEQDSDPLVFLHYFATSLRRRFPHFGARTFRLLDEARSALVPDPSLAFSVLGTLISELDEQIADFFVLILDDYHVLPADSLVHTLMGLFLAYLPAGAHVVLATRTLPPLAVSKLVADGQVGGLSPRDLALSAAEAREILRIRAGLEVSDQEAADLVRQSGGWVLGLLASVRNRVATGHAVQALCAVSGAAALYQALAEDTITLLAPADQRMLYAAALLEIAPAGLIDAALGTSGAAALLSRLCDETPFVMPLEERRDVYRLHQLFCEHVVRCFDTRSPRWRLTISRALARAARTGGNDDLAVRLLLGARDISGAVQIIRRGIEGHLAAGRFSLAASWLNALPQAAVEQDARLLLARARVLAFRGDRFGALELAERAVQRAKRVERALLTRARILVSILLSGCGRPRDGEELALRLLEELHSRRQARDLADVYRALSMACYAQDKLEPALTYMERALPLYEREGRLHDVGVALNQIGACHNQLGRPQEASIFYQRALALREQIGDLAGVATSSNNVGLLAYQRGDYEQAQSAFERARDIARTLGSVRTLAYAYANLADLYRTTGQLDQALAAYEQAAQAAREAGERPLVVYCDDGQATTLQQAGRLEEASRLLARARQQAEELGSARLLARVTITEGALAFHRGALHLARDLLEQGRSRAEQAKDRRQEGRALLLLAEVYHRLHLDQQALEALELLARLGATLGSREFIVAEGKRIIPLLRYAVEQRPAETIFLRALDEIDAAAAAAVRAELARQEQAGQRYPRLVCHLLGKPEVYVERRLLDDDAFTVDRARLLLLYLSLFPAGRSREDLQETLWPEAEPGAVASRFHVTLYHLRKALFPDIVVRRSGWYRLNPAVEVSTDVKSFLRHLEASRDERLSREQRLEELRAAVELYRGPLLPDLDSELIRERRAELERRYLEALGRLAEAAYDDGDYRACLRFCHRILEVDPHAEEAHARLMHCLSQLGENLAALAHYRHYVRALRREDPAASPSAFLMDLYQELLRLERERSRGDAL